MANNKPPSLPLPTTNSNNAAVASPRVNAVGLISSPLTAGASSQHISSLQKGASLLPSTSSHPGPHYPSSHVLPHPQYSSSQSQHQSYSQTHNSSSSTPTTLQTAQQYYTPESSFSQQYVNMDFAGHPHVPQSQNSSSHPLPSSGGNGSNGTNGSISQYSPQHLQSNYHQQSPAHSAYPQYQFPASNGLSQSSHQTPTSGAGLPSQVVPNLLPLQRGHMASNGNGISANGPSPSNSVGVGSHQNGSFAQAFDTTGQIPPQGMKPRVTATLWEDEGSLCFQVEAKGVCVARREDNHMINGTKLLNVAGMTRGRRDGILKSEKVRHVVKIGPMHLKGVWIPFERALEFANKEKITETLYPLFVHNINSLLYHPTNQNRTTALSQAVDSRKLSDYQQQHLVQQQQQQQQQQHLMQQQQRRTDTVSSSPSQITPGSMQHPSSVPSSIPHLPPHHALHPHHSSHLNRPGIERSVSFPTPPPSTSGMMGLGTSDSQYWNSSAGMIPANQQLGIDTVINSRSMPSTPATTPPSANPQPLQSYSASYNDSYRPSPNSVAQPQHSIAQTSSARFSTHLPQSQSQYTSHARNQSDMGPPPSSRGQTNIPSRPSPRQNSGDVKEDSRSSEGDEHEGEHGEEEAEHEAEHEHEDEYTHDNGQAYHNSRTPYYSSIGSVSGEHGNQIASELATSNHPASSLGTQSRSPFNIPSLAVPRTVETPTSTNNRPGTNQGHWPPPSSYTMGARSQDHGDYDSVYQSNRSTAPESQANVGYPSASNVGASVPSSYGNQSHSPIANGLSVGTKRGRDADGDDNHSSRPSSRTGDDRGAGESDSLVMKRRKIAGAPLSSPGISPLSSNSFDREANGRLNRRSGIMHRGRH